MYEVRQQMKFRSHIEKQIWAESLVLHSQVEVLLLEKSSHCQDLLNDFRCQECALLSVFLQDAEKVIDAPQSTFQQGVDVCFVFCEINEKLQRNCSVPPLAMEMTKFSCFQPKLATS